MQSQLILGYLLLEGVDVVAWTSEADAIAQHCVQYLHQSKTLP